MQKPFVTQPELLDYGGDYGAITVTGDYGAITDYGDTITAITVTVY